MWDSLNKVGGVTNKVVVPSDGIITLKVPTGIDLAAYINDEESPPHHFHVNAGDSVYFMLKGAKKLPASVSIEYDGKPYTLEVMDVGIVKSDLTKGANMADMMDGVNLFTGGSGGGAGTMGAGLGAGLLGGVLGGALLGNRRGGLLGGDDGYVGGAGPHHATTSDVQNTVNDAAIMTQLADIKAAVPLAEGQVQLALAGAQMALTSTINDGTSSIIAANGSGVSTIMSNLNMQTQLNTKGFSDAQLQLANTGFALMDATKQNRFDITSAINNDGDKTRALIQSIDKSNDSRLITTLANEVSELRGDRRMDAARESITITNNNNATAIAQQQQAQQQAQQLLVLNAQLQALVQQNQHIQQGVLNIGSGTVKGTNQTSANTSVH